MSANGPDQKPGWTMRTFVEALNEPSPSSTNTESTVGARESMAATDVTVSIPLDLVADPSIDTVSVPLDLVADPAADDVDEDGW